jgi:lipopolysaccharide export system permease protein
MLLAIPLGFVNPRAGASSNLILALLIFFTYLNLTKAAEKAVEQGRLAFAAGWWPLHLLVLLVALGLFAWRMNVNHRLHPMVLLNAFKRRRLLQSADAREAAK